MSAISRRTRVIEGADAASLPVADLIADGRPAILRGIARDVPLVAAGLKGPESAIAWLKQIDGGKPVTAYVADGHHRTASAARVGLQCRANGTNNADSDWFLAVLFPANQLQILPNNRAVRDLNGLSKE